MPASSLPPHPFISLWDIMNDIDLAKRYLDRKPNSYHHTKPRQLIGRVSRHFVKHSFYVRDEENKRTLESGTCSWCERHFLNRREFFEHGVCRQPSDDETPTMRQARIWILETEEELKQLKRGARAADGGVLAVQLRRHAARKHAYLRRLESAREQLKKDVRSFERRGSKGLVRQYERDFLRVSRPNPIQVAGMTTHQTTLHRDRYLGWAVRGVEDVASRLTGKRCRVPYVHR